MAFWHLLSAFATPPEDKPDLWVVINACVGAVCFGICYLWCFWKLVSESGLFDQYLAHQDTIETEVDSPVQSTTPKKKARWTK